MPTMILIRQYFILYGVINVAMVELLSTQPEELKDGKIKKAVTPQQQWLNVSSLETEQS